MHTVPTYLCRSPRISHLPVVAVPTFIETGAMHDKQTLRNKLMRARKAHHAAHGAAAGQALVARLDDLALAPQSCIGLYLPVGSEMDCRPLMRALDAAGHILCLPSCIAADAALAFRAYALGDALFDDALGMAAPPASATPCRPDMVLVPLIGFDASGMRLGRGGGYYDRTLAQWRADPAFAQKRLASCGVAYDMQMVDKCPAAPHDQALDAVITETSLYRFARS